MGLSGISPWSLLLILIIALLFFGTDRVKSLGVDLAKIIKDFRHAMDDETTKNKRSETPPTKDEE